MKNDHKHTWHLFPHTVSGEIVALCDDPDCPEFLSQEQVTERLNAAELRSHSGLLPCGHSNAYQAIRLSDNKSICAMCEQQTA